MTAHELSILFFLQLTFILIVIRLVGVLARRIGQPQVVGEMIAGVLMGPSFFGLLAPEIQQSLFREESISLIYAVSQVGLVLYMFLIGAEFNLALIRERYRSAVAVSVAGIAAPFILGGLLATRLVSNEQLFAPGVDPWEAALFMGAAMSITAFPMLARIIYEKGMTHTPLGTLALAAGSLDDVSAWCILALVLASFGGTPSLALVTIGGGILYGAAVLLLLRPALRHLGRHAEQQQALTPAMLGGILALVMFGAWLTDILGIYAVFGAFMVGIAMPRGLVTEQLHRQLEPLTTNLLLPLFFIYSGLKTYLGLVVSPLLWGVMILVILTACLGKLVACWAAARWQGESQRDALGIGILMNSRGLMELILLNIALEQGIIRPALFAIMVIMAIVTTLMTSPLFERLYRLRPAPLLDLVERPVPSAD